MYEIWGNGKIKERYDAVSTIIEEGFDGEISIYMQGINNTDLENPNSIEMRTAISGENGQMGSTKDIEKFSQSYIYAPREISATCHVGGTSKTRRIKWKSKV